MLHNIILTAFVCVPICLRHFNLFDRYCTYVVLNKTKEEGGSSLRPLCVILNEEIFLNNSLKHLRWFPYLIPSHCINYQGFLISWTSKSFSVNLREWNEVSVAVSIQHLLCLILKHLVWMEVTRSACAGRVTLSCDSLKEKKKNLPQHRQ